MPTRVLVFKSDNSFKPFKPLYQGKPALLAGFFQKGMDVNHICLTSEYSEERPFAAVYHEYVHQLTGDNIRNLPLWFREGIAEYYSSFEAAEKDRQISVGKPIPVTCISCARIVFCLSPRFSRFAMIRQNTTNATNRECSMPSRGLWFIT